jgi:hypothetical protein
VSNREDTQLGRRRFLQSAALGGVAAVAAPVVGAQTEVAADAPSAKNASAPKLDASQPRPVAPHANAEESTPRDESATYSSCGGDYMVDVLRSLGIEYFAATPGKTFMGMHEAVINYGMLTPPNALLGTLGMQAAGVLAADKPGNATRGKQLYMNTGCYQCHGTRGAGGGFAGPRLTPTPIPFEGFLQQLRHPRARMPIYTADTHPCGFPSNYACHGGQKSIRTSRGPLSLIPARSWRSRCDRLLLPLAHIDVAVERA